MLDRKAKELAARVEYEMQWKTWLEALNDEARWQYAEQRQEWIYYVRSLTPEQLNMLPEVQRVQFVELQQRFAHMPS